jgi:hypothetical protein
MYGESGRADHAKKQFACVRAAAARPDTTNPTTFVTAIRMTFDAAFSTVALIGVPLQHALADAPLPISWIR